MIRITQSLITQNYFSESIAKPFDEATAVASKAIDSAVYAAIPSPQIAASKTPKVAPVLSTPPPSKRVSFGPYVSPEIIDKVISDIIYGL